jgi:DNA-directed RNA polymerase subunit RPC12/RpoP
MFDFCPHCGQTIEVEQVVGRMLVCGMCGKDVGFVGGVERRPQAESESRIQAGAAARCPLCDQVVEIKRASLVPHYRLDATKKICPGSGKPAPVAGTASTGHAKLDAHMTRDVVKVLSCTRSGDARIEVLTLEYLDKSERVRIQIEALREMLGHDFQMRDYPAPLNRLNLVTWVGDDACVVARRHERGGFQSIADTEISMVLEELRKNCAVFFA